MNKGKLKFLAAMAMALLVALAAGAAHAGYVLVVKNQTGHEIDAEAW